MTPRQPATAEPDRPCVLVVVGAPGTPEYASQFGQWADQWQAAAEKAGAESIPIGTSGAGGDDRERLRGPGREGGRHGQGDGHAEPAREPLWIVLIGHGTSDGREAKFNLRGPDVTDLELAEWLAPIKRPVAVLDCTSASGPFLNRLSGADRVVVTATKSGHEQNFARFGQYLAEAIADPAPTSTRTARSRSSKPSSPPAAGPTSITAPTRNWPPSTPCSTTTATSWALPPTGSAASAPPAAPRTAPRSTASGPTSST